MPLFTIIVVHYQGTISNAVFERGQRSIEAQTFRDFEVLRYHDGPLLDPSIQERWPIKCTQRRHNDWGHSLRDIGIREARGEYILHFNADNVLYPNALEEIVREINRPHRIVDNRGNILDRNNVVIFPVKMWGLSVYWPNVIQSPNRNVDYYTILSGNPPFRGNIDCMQLVMRRDLWLREGGWRDKRAASDGDMYPEFAMKYGYRHVGPVLGEHF